MLNSDTTMYNRIGNKIINPATCKQRLRQLHFLALVLLPSLEAGEDLSAKEKKQKLGNAFMSPFVEFAKQILGQSDFQFISTIHNHNTMHIIILFIVQELINGNELGLRETKIKTFDIMLPFSGKNLVLALQYTIAII